MNLDALDSDTRDRYREELDKFYTEQHQRMVRVIRSLHRSLDIEAIQDIVAATFLHDAWVKWDEVRAMERPEGWLVRRALRRCQDEYRKKQRQQNLIEKLKGAYQQAFPSKQQYQVTDSLIVQIDLETVLRQLPLHQRTAVVLRYWGDFRVREVAEIMGKPYDTVKDYLQQAMKKLRRDFDVDRPGVQP